MESIVYHPIGIIHTPYKEPRNMPIQGRYNKYVDGYCTIQNEFQEGLTDLEHFSHAILIYHLHKSKVIHVVEKPFLENAEHGIFAVRSPNRPNKIGISVVRILKILENKLHFTEVDMLDGTPLLDIKPFVGHFDSRKNVKSGWVDKHFENGRIPDDVILD